MIDTLDRVKKGLGITGKYQDDTILEYISEVKRFLIDGGVEKSIVEADSTVGLIIRGVSDLWNYGSGGATLSPYFIQRATQLAYKAEGDNDE